MQRTEIAQSAPIVGLAFVSHCCGAGIMQAPDDDHPRCVRCDENCMQVVAWITQVNCPEHGMHQQALPVELAGVDGWN